MPKKRHRVLISSPKEWADDDTAYPVRTRAELQSALDKGLITLDECIDRMLALPTSHDPALLYPGERLRHYEPPDGIWHIWKEKTGEAHDCDKVGCKLPRSGKLDDAFYKQ
jgi:hypothetical protein